MPKGRLSPAMETVCHRLQVLLWSGPRPRPLRLRRDTNFPWSMVWSNFPDNLNSPRSSGHKAGLAIAEALPRVLRQTNRRVSLRLQQQFDPDVHGGSSYGHSYYRNECGWTEWIRGRRSHAYREVPLRVRLVGEDVRFITSLGTRGR
jgi:hypothetical protein